MRNRWTFICLLAAAAELASAAVAQRVLTETGTISGVRLNGLSVYKGVPFAAPPVGELRWRPPGTVPLLLGSNAQEARAMIDVTHETAATFESDMEHSVGQLPAPLLAAYPHTTDEGAKQARLGLERDLRFGWDMWAWARLQADTGQQSVYYYLFQQQPPFPTGSVYEGWGASHFAELWYVFDHLDQEPWRWSAADRRVAEEMSSYWINFAKSGNPNGPDLPQWPAFTNMEPRVQYLGDPITVGGVANINGLTVFDAVYTTVRGKPFGAR